MHTDCPGTTVCYLGECTSSDWLNWDANYSTADLECVDGVGTCRLLFATWEYQGNSWTESPWTNLYVTEWTWLSLIVTEEDLLVDDFIGEFQFNVHDAILAWKAGTLPLVIEDVEGTGKVVSMWITPQL